jgi:hypothetical protein
MFCWVEELFIELKKNVLLFFLIFSILNLPSVRKKVLGKKRFAECFLPSVTLGKGFAECKIAFAECLRHSAKNAIPAVIYW